MSDVPQYEQDDGALTKDQLDQIAADQTPWTIGISLRSGSMERGAAL